MYDDKKMNEWNKLYYGGLVGAKCVGVKSETDDEGNCWPKLTFEKDGERFVTEVSMDEEGNGPGFLFGLPMVSAADNPFRDES